MLGTSRPEVLATDEAWMNVALAEAEHAARIGEVPVGAVVVHNGKLLARSFNLREIRQDPTAHAEMLALQAAAGRIGNFRLNGCTLYATLEPCPMCAGALVNARVDRLVYGASDPKAGAIDTLFAIATDPRLNHRIQVSCGVLAERCAGLLTRFFETLRRDDREAEGA